MRYVSSYVQKVQSDQINQGIRSIRRPGMGDVTGDITSAAVASLTPAIKDIMVNDVLPMLGVFMVTGAVAAAFIGTWFGHRASRASSGVRRNPVPSTYIKFRRRRGA